MNVEKMMKVADAIEKQTHAKFNMCTWILDLPSVCGTIACVAGTAILMERRTSEITFPEDYASVGRDILGLDQSEANHLFVGNPTPGAMPIMLEDINCHAGLVPDALRWMALNEKINWHQALKAAACLRDNQPPSPGTREPEIVTA